MTTPSSFAELGFSVKVYSPVITGLSTREVYDIADGVSTYTHTILANGGFDRATIGIPDRVEYVEWWLENGLGLHVQVFNAAGLLCWEGFVNSIRATIGGLTIQRGPLLDIANRVRVVYSAVDTATTPPTVGNRERTAYADNTTSQNLYGIWTKVLSTGGAAQATAEQIRDTYIAGSALPIMGQQITIGGGSAPGITIDCLGYWHFLKAYPYNVTTTGDTTISARLQAILAASPNAVFSTDYSAITANTFAIPAYENDDRLALAYLLALVSIGDVSNNRYLAGVYENRKFFYSAQPTTTEYEYRIADDDVKTVINGSVIYPWDVRPGKWAFVPDFLPGYSGSTLPLQSDPRNVFIESVTYTMPWGLQLTGSKFSTLPQMLSKLGLTGVGA